MISKGLKDEVFVIRELDLIIEVHAIIDYISQHPEEVDLYEASIGDIKGFIQSDKINYSSVEEVGEQRIIEPLLIIELHNVVRVIDGNHRLLKRELDGLLKCSFYLIPAEILVKFSSPLSCFKTERRFKNWKKQVFGGQYA